MAVAFDSRLAEEYAALFAALVINPGRREEVERLVARILLPANRARYAAVEAACGVPWFVVGLIHNLEASGSFRAHLHNGDPLTARTVREPASRRACRRRRPPMAPPTAGRRAPPTLSPTTGSTVGGTGRSPVSPTRWSAITASATGAAIRT
ncbi:hypothetical protein [Xanthobacter pseudotagetidis]|uniref:hypothetical protein n=1 Tax=Xanthobacter pseudotagetidis TaxID=3119911 RepID=UPI00372A9EBB